MIKGLWQIRQFCKTLIVLMKLEKFWVFMDVYMFTFTVKYLTGVWLLFTATGSNAKWFCSDFPFNSTSSKSVKTWLVISNDGTHCGYKILQLFIMSQSMKSDMDPVSGLFNRAWIHIWFHTLHMTFSNFVYFCMF